MIRYAHWVLLLAALHGRPMGVVLVTIAAVFLTTRLVRWRLHDAG